MGIIYDQKQLPRDVLKKSCSENIQEIYRRTPMPKYDFNKIAKQKKQKQKQNKNQKKTMKLNS